MKATVIVVDETGRGRPTTVEWAGSATVGLYIDDVSITTKNFFYEGAIEPVGVAAYEQDYKAVPASYAFQAYDAAALINGALTDTKGNTADKTALRAALMKADFNSLRGAFRFNTNHYPIQDFYLTKVAKRADGKFQTEIVQKVFENYGDRYAKDCTPGN